MRFFCAQATVTILSCRANTYRQSFLVEKVIGNAEDEAEEEFIVDGDHTFTINIAVTDNDWERPLDEEGSDLGAGEGPDDDDDEGKDGDGRGDYAGEGKPGKKKVSYDFKWNHYLHTILQTYLHILHTYIHIFILK